MIKGWLGMVSGVRDPSAFSRIIAMCSRSRTMENPRDSKALITRRFGASFGKESTQTTASPRYASRTGDCPVMVSGPKVSMWTEERIAHPQVLRHRYHPRRQPLLQYQVDRQDTHQGASRLLSSHFSRPTSCFNDTTSHGNRQSTGVCERIPLGLFQTPLPETCKISKARECPRGLSRHGKPAAGLCSGYRKAAGTGDSRLRWTCPALNRKDTGRVWQRDRRTLRRQSRRVGKADALAKPTRWQSRHVGIADASAEPTGRFCGNT